MTTLTLRVNYRDTTYFYRHHTGKIKSLTKVMGGKDIVKRSRYWCDKGLSGWVNEWFVDKKEKQNIIWCALTNGVDKISFEELDRKTYTYSFTDASQKETVCEITDTID